MLKVLCLAFATITVVSPLASVAQVSGGVLEQAFSGKLVVPATSIGLEGEAQDAYSKMYGKTLKLL